MKYIIGILLVVTAFGNIGDIAKVNSLKKKAKEAYTNGEYQVALQHYQFLVDSMNVVDDNIKLNMANAYYQLKDTTNAINNYSDLLASNNKAVRSVANQQTGIIKNKQKKYEEALDHFKEALKADPTNEDARYNYELLKKVLKEKEEQQKNQDQNDKDKNQDKDKENKDNKDQQNKDQQKQDQNKEDQEKQNEEQQKQDQEGQEDKDKQDEQQKKEEEKKEGEEKDKEQQKPEDAENKDQEKPTDQEPSLSEKLKDMKISEEKAKMILEAMKNNEIQYIQQNKRKPTKKKDPDKPDW
ncbi:tetratricopeptide repeat protein [Fulvivirga sp.]|uniref:tetratricopeptide repeat protein n=1 Tax=Fulvivirga sp. TaxID=1931237 RepID=UPI0032EFFBB5